MHFKRHSLGNFLFFFFIGLNGAAGCDLVDITTISPGIRIDIKYASTDNFTHKKVYDREVCYLRREVAHALARVQKELESMGLGLLIWDGYRPVAVQRIFWDLVPDERYVMPPTKGSRHNRGAAVDLTLVTKDGKKLLMPTDFDDFSDKAHADYRDLPQEAIKNRELLKTVMEKHGFKVLRWEWWHFDYKDWQRFDLLDVSFSDLAAAQA